MPPFKYRADIDGLRAIAVLSVVGFHVFPSYVPGGFVGVDVFFVISGYLISSLILSRLREGRFSFLEFYTSRVRRIFPALVLVLAASLAVGWFILLPNELQLLGKHVAAGAAFVSNIAFWSESGYFDTKALAKPLLHLWSLGIEEQFYLLWPLLLWLIWRPGRFGGAAIVVIVIGSFAANIGIVGSDRTAAFYAPYTRIWELGAGAGFAWFRSSSHSVPSSRWRQDLAGTLGLAFIAAGILLTRESFEFPGWWSLLPVVGALLAISSPHAWTNRCILSHRAAVGIGLISYPLYLWHWPLISYVSLVHGGLPGREARVLIVLSSIVLAWLTYQFIEKPARFGAFRTSWSIPLCVAIGALAISGLYVWRSDSRDTSDYRAAQFIRASDEWEYPASLTAFTFMGETAYRRGAQSAQTTLFMGDSFIEQYYARIDELASTGPAITNSVIFFTTGNCMMIPGVDHEPTPSGCSKRAKVALDLALTAQDISTVVIGGDWWWYFGGYDGRYLLSEGSRLKVTPGSEGYLRTLSALGKLVRELRSRGKVVYFLLSTPRSPLFDPRNMVERSLKTFPNVFSIHTNPGLPRSVIESSFGVIQRDLTAEAVNAGAEVVDPLPWLCSNEYCEGLDKRGFPIYRDEAHLRPSYVREHARYVDRTVRPVLTP